LKEVLCLVQVVHVFKESVENILTRSCIYLETSIIYLEEDIPRYVLRKYFGLLWLIIQTKQNPFLLAPIKCFKMCLQICFALQLAASSSLSYKGIGSAYSMDATLSFDEHDKYHIVLFVQFKSNQQGKASSRHNISIKLN